MSDELLATLSDEQKSLLGQAVANHKAGINGGINGWDLKPEQMEHVNELLVKGLVFWFPPGKKMLLFPTPLARDSFPEADLPSVSEDKDEAAESAPEPAQ